MASIGDMLRTAREAQGRSAADVASELCITERYLRAIEEGDVNVLPGLFFYQSFARQYGAILGLDGKALHKALTDAAGVPEIPGEDPASGLLSSHRASPSPSSTYVPTHRAIDPVVEHTNHRYFAGYPLGLSAAALVATVVLGSGVFAWWNRAPQSVPVADAVPGKAVSIPMQGGSATPVTAPSGPTTLANASNQVVLNLSATEETWLSITSHGKVIFSGTLQPSESKTLNGVEVATIRIGNAGGVEIQWNGKAIGPLGPRGQVRTVRFTRQDFHVESEADQAPSDNGTAATQHQL